MNNNNENNKIAIPYEIKLTDTGIATVPSGTAAKNASSAGTAATATAPTKKGFNFGIIYSIAGFILGIVSLVAVIILGFFSLPLSALGPIALLPYGIGIVTCIVGIILSSIGRRNGDAPNLAKAGLIMNIIPLIVIGALIVLLFVGCASCAGIIAMLSQG